MNLTPIVLYNNTLSATSTPFQQMLTIPANASINSTYTNIRFRDGNYNLLTSWLESYTTSSATIWVVLPDGILSKSALTIYMETGSLSDNFLDDITVGEAPQLSATYGQYDNGAKVFSFYDNFAGTSLSSKWTSSGNVVVANGVQIIGNQSNFGGIKSNVSYSNVDNIVIEALANLYGSNGSEIRVRPYAWLSTQPIEDGVNGNNYTSVASNFDMGYYSNETLSNQSQYYFNSASSSTSPVSNSVTDYVFIHQIVLYSGGFQWNTLSPSHSVLNTNTDSTVLSSDSFSIYFECDSYSATSSYSQINIGWVRTRAYPPNGTMPIQVNELSSTVNITEGLII